MLIIRDGGLFDIPMPRVYITGIRLEEVAPHDTTEDDILKAEDDILKAIEDELNVLNKRLKKAESLVNDIDQDINTLSDIIDILEKSHKSKENEDK